MMAKFEAMGLLSVEPGKGRKPASVETMEVALGVEEARMKNTHNTCCLSHVE